MSVASSLDQLPSLLASLGVKNPLYVCSARWVRTLNAQKAPVFSDFHANPDFDACAAGMCMYLRRRCDGLVAMGGGSAMDTAKGIRAMLLSPSPERALDMIYTGICPMICIPTTAGSGSEATPTAVLYVDGAKFSLSSPALVPDHVILDESTLASLPFEMKRSCALDALCQAIESYWCRSATASSRSIAGNVISGILQVLRVYLEYNACSGAMLRLSYRAGQAIAITRTTAAHAMSYQVTKCLNVPHGDACALTLPFLWLHALKNPALSPVMEELASLMGVPSPEDAPLLFLGMCRAFGLKAPGMPEKDIFDHLVSSVNVERLGNHPETLTRGDLAEIYRLALDPASAAEIRERADAVWRTYGT